MNSSLSQNRLLNSLPERVRSAIVAECVAVDLPVRTSLFRVDEPPRHIHFMTSGIASIVTAMQSGELVEVGIVGSEGFPEKTHVLGPQSSVTRCFIQIKGTALRMDLRRFQVLFTTTPELLKAVHAYVQHDALVLGQIGACNRLHDVEPRLARWLLMVYDRLGVKTLPLTQEFLGEMLGARRSSVNLAASSLQRAGTIEYTRGQITIVDPEALCGVACECYPLIAKLFRDLYQVGNLRPQLSADCLEHGEGPA